MNLLFLIKRFFTLLKKRIVVEFIIVSLLSSVLFVFSAKYDFMERLMAFSKVHEEWEIDEILILCVFLLIIWIITGIRKSRELNESKNILIERNQKLNNALNEIKELRGIIPICSSCKKIRNDEGAWQQVEVYVEKHSHAQFSHGLCPDCAEKYYSDLIKTKKSENQ